MNESDKSRIRSHASEVVIFIVIAEFLHRQTKVIRWRSVENLITIVQSRPYVSSVDCQ